MRKKGIWTPPKRFELSLGNHMCVASSSPNHLAIMTIECGAWRIFFFMYLINTTTHNNNNNNNNGVNVKFVWSLDYPLSID